MTGRAGRARPAPCVGLVLHLPCRAASLPLVRHLAAQVLVGADVVPDVVASIELALSEACTNVLDHAQGSDGYEVRLEIQGDRCEIQVIDGGRGIVPAEPAPPHGQVGTAERGRGVAIMEAVMDHVALVPAPGAGTRVDLVTQLAFFPASTAPSVLGASGHDNGARPPGTTDP